jgi:hypothetical protein
LWLRHLHSAPESTKFGAPSTEPWRSTPFGRAPRGAGAGAGAPFGALPKGILK